MKKQWNNTENHEKTMKKMANNEKQWKMKQQWKIMKNHEKNYEK